MSVISNGQQVKCLSNGNSLTGTIISHFESEENGLSYIIQLLDGSRIILDYQCVEKI